MSSSCEEDVMRIKKKLEKMMKLNEIEASVSLDMLNTLRKLPMDLQILKNTGIGVVLNNLRKSCNHEELGTLAKSLLKNWKKLVASDSQLSTPNNTPTTGISSPNSNSNDSKPPMSPVQTNNATNLTPNGAVKRSLSGSPDTNEKNAKQPNLTQSNSSNSLKNESIKKTESLNNKPANKTNGLNNNNNVGSNEGKKTFARATWSETKDPVRNKCREMLVNALEILEPIENGAILCEASEIANRCEEAIFNEFKNTDVKYKNRVRSRVINLKDAKNPKFKESVRLGMISAERLASMPAEEMASEQMKELRAKFTKQAIDDHQMARTQGAKTSLLTCSKCKKNNVAYSEMQTRSADEPMTTFAYCLECGHRWKFG